MCVDSIFVSESIEKCGARVFVTPHPCLWNLIFKGLCYGVLNAGNIYTLRVANHPDTGFDFLAMVRE